MRPKRRLLAVLLAGAAITAACSASSPPGKPVDVKAAAADPARAADAAVDVRRHGPEILAFSGLTQGGVAIDLIPGGGYWTRLFAKAVGPQGHVYGIWPKPYAMEAKTDVENYKKLAGSADFPNVSAAIEPATELTAPAKADLVFTAQNYHDYPDKFMGPVDPAVLNKAVFDALKPGGIYLIIDHAAASGSGLRDTDTLHRIDPAIVKQQVTAAGFTFVGESKLLANPADDHTIIVFDKAIRGKTDQFIYKFKKLG
ncbi:MAG: methyltransferase [Sphingomonas sp.]